MLPNTWILAAVMAALASTFAPSPSRRQTTPDEGGRRSTATVARAAVVMDVTPQTQIWPKLHVAYDFDRQTVTMIQINEDGIRVLSVKPLNRAEGSVR
jgi:hypothetical protein